MSLVTNPFYVNFFPFCLVMQLWDELARTSTSTSTSSSSAVCILGATNRPQDLDPAILRRFERSYYIPPPDLQARYEVLKTHLKGVSLQKDCNLALCATRASGFTSSDLAAACRDAVRHQQMQARKRQQAGGDGLVQPLSTQVCCLFMLYLYIHC